MNSASRLAGRQLALNSIWNLAGQSAPLLVALVSIPHLLHGLGTSRFGILTIAWALTGYFSIFDLGIGRALTKIVADRIGRERPSDIAPIVNSGLAFMMLLGVAGAAVMALASRWLVSSAFNVPDTEKGEAIVVMRLLALSLPFVILTAGLRGVLEAYQRFPVLNIIRIVLGITNFLLPLLILPFANDLGAMVVALLMSRIVTTYAHWYFCAQELPAVSLSAGWGHSYVRELLSFGGWMTVSNVVGPLMVYLDRFLLGVYLSMSAVAFYATPYELVTKLWLIPAAIVSVLFPAFSTTLACDPDRALRLYERGLRYIFLALFPPVLLVVGFSRFGLQLWLGHDFAAQSTAVIQWLAVAVFINSLAQIPFIYIQAAGRPDVTAKFHLVELPCYITALILLVRAHGITGAAIAWLGRMVIDAGLLFYAAQRHHACINRKHVLAFVGAMLLFLVAVLCSHGHLSATAFPVFILAGFIAAAWRWGLRDDERGSILQAFRLKQNEDPVKAKA